MSKITVRLDVSTDNEGTRAPWWAIIDPKQNMDCNIHSAAHQFTGPFFSREEAQSYLSGTLYNFSDRARVYCMSGCYSRRYEQAYASAEKEATP